MQRGSALEEIEWVVRKGPGNGVPIGMEGIWDRMPVGPVRGQQEVPEKDQRMARREPLIGPGFYAPLYWLWIEMNILYFMTIDEWMAELWIEEGGNRFDGSW